MPKVHRGGQRGATLTANASLNQNNDTQTQVDDTQEVEKLGRSYQEFIALSDDEKADAINQYIADGVPNHLANNDFQKIIYNMEMNDKPQLVDDSVLDTMNGTEMFRTVNSVYDSQHDIGYTPTQIADQIAKGNITRVSDTGGSAYGRGIYFAKNLSSSEGYGHTRNDITKTAVIRAKLNANAKIITESKAISGARNEIASGSKLGKALSKMSMYDAQSTWALCRGYNVIDANDFSGYMVVLNRGAISISKTYKAKRGTGRW